MQAASRRLRPARGLLVAVLLVLAAPVSAEPYAVGATLPELALADQHGQSHAIDASTRLVLFSRDMDGGKVIQQALKGSDADSLAERGAVYVSDVSRMPGLVRRIIAKPRMRRRPYPMLLDEEGTATADFPSESGKATLLVVEGLRVTRIDYVSTPASVEAALGGEPTP
jgi:hypothetical protein